MDLRPVGVSLVGAAGFATPVMAAGRVPDWLGSRPGGVGVLTAACRDGAGLRSGLGTRRVARQGEAGCGVPRYCGEETPGGHIAGPSGAVAATPLLSGVPASRAITGVARLRTLAGPPGGARPGPSSGAGCVPHSAARSSGAPGAGPESAATPGAPSPSGAGVSRPQEDGRGGRGPPASLTASALAPRLTLQAGHDSEWFAQVFGNAFPVSLWKEPFKNRFCFVLFSW